MKLLGRTLRPTGIRSRYTYLGPQITRGEVDEDVARDSLKWQDPLDPTCTDPDAVYVDFECLPGVIVETRIDLTEKTVDIT